MDDVKQESNTATAEQKVKAEDVNSQAGADASKETDGASEVDIEALVLKRAQSLKDKELKAVYARIQELEGKAENEKKQKAAKDEEDKLFGIMDEEIENAIAEGASDKKIRSLQDIAENLRKQHRILMQNTDDFNGKYAPLIAQAVALQQFREVWNEIEGDKPIDFTLAGEFMDSLKDEKVNSAEVINNKAIRFVLKKKTTGTEVEKPKRPDSNAHTNTGRKAPKTASELVAEGLSKLRNK